MQLYWLFLATIIALASPVLPQNNSQLQDPSSCVTPENKSGFCVALSNCPQLANIIQNSSHHSFRIQSDCEPQNRNEDPVVCCSNPSTVPQHKSRPRRQTQRSGRVFFPTDAPEVTRPTQAPKPIAAASSTATKACKGPDTRDGTCLPLQQCKLLYDELRIRQSELEFQNYLRESNKVCGGAATDVCCPINVASSPLIRNTNEVPRRLPTVQEGCGYTPITLQKIVGGVPSKKGAWPWVALIGYDDDLSPTPFKCGGALITARHVVTAAHCLRSDLTFVRLGEHDLTTDTEADHVDIKVVRTEKHPNYTPRDSHSDIAILYLERNVVFTVSISPICLPTTPELRQKSYVKHSPFVVGWGKTMEGGVSADVLQQLQLPIYDNSFCRDRYSRERRLFSDKQFDAAVICAGFLPGGKDTCLGDSGGPLMMPEAYKNDSRYYLIGVVSYSIGCARPEIPGVYTSTQYFIDWIIEKVADTP